MEQQIEASRGQSSPTEVVQAFIAAGRAKDVARCGALLHDDAVSQLVPFRAGKSRKDAERTLRFLFSFPGTFNIDVHKIAEHGNTVLTVRTDSVSGSWLAISFWVCGTFEVRDGKIILWRDYFDVGSFFLKAVVSPIRALILALQHK